MANLLRFLFSNQEHCTAHGCTIHSLSHVPNPTVPVILTLLFIFASVTTVFRQTSRGGEGGNGGGWWRRRRGSPGPGPAGGGAGQEPATHERSHRRRPRPAARRAATHSDAEGRGRRVPQGGRTGGTRAPH